MQVHGLFVFSSILLHFDLPPVGFGSGAEPPAELTVEIGLAGETDLVYHLFPLHVRSYNESGGVF